MIHTASGVSVVYTITRCCSASGTSVCLLHQNHKIIYLQFFISELQPPYFISETTLQTEDYCVQATPFGCDRMKAKIQVDKVRSETICLVPGVTDNDVFDTKVKVPKCDNDLKNRIEKKNWIKKKKKICRIKIG